MSRLIRLDSDIDSAVLARARQRALIEGRDPRVSDFLLNPHRFGGGGGGATDPLYSSVALLLHMDGSNGGTTFTDNSPTPKTVTPTAVTTSTAQAKFGISSALFPAASSTEKLTIPHSSDLAPTGDFCVEMWVRLSSASSQRALIWKSVSTGHTTYAMRLTTGSQVQCFASNAAGSAFQINMTGSITVNTSGTWQHIAFDRNGSNYRLFIHGVLDTSASSAGAGYVNAAHSVTIGNVTDNSLPLGVGGDSYIDDVRITTASRYTASFTPPSSPFPNS